MKGPDAGRHTVCVVLSDWLLATTGTIVFADGGAIHPALVELPRAVPGQGDSATLPFRLTRGPDQALAPFPAAT